MAAELRDGLIFEGATVIDAKGHLVIFGLTSGSVPPFDINRLSGITGTGNLILKNNSALAAGITISSTAVNNTGTIAGGLDGILGMTTATVSNSGSIAGGMVGVTANTVNVNNSGSITGTTINGIYAGTDATVTNNAGASITGNTVQSDANFGIGIHASNQKAHWNDILKILVVDQVYDSLQGVTLAGNKFINLTSAITGSLNGAMLSTNSCTTVTVSTGCQQ